MSITAKGQYILTLYWLLVHLTKHSQSSFSSHSSCQTHLQSYFLCLRLQTNCNEGSCSSFLQCSLTSHVGTHSSCVLAALQADETPGQRDAEEFIEVHRVSVAQLRDMLITTDMLLPTMTTSYMALERLKQTGHL